jgi:hypothetical protein
MVLLGLERPIPHTLESGQKALHHRFHPGELPTHIPCRPHRGTVLEGRLGGRLRNF